MNAKKVLSASGITGFVAFLVDVVVNGGDLLLWVAELFVTQGPLLYVLLARLSRLAPRIEFLPAGSIERALYVVAGLVALVTVYRLVSNVSAAWRSRK